MNSRGRRLSEGVPIRYQSLSFRSLPLLSGSPSPQTQVITVPAPAGYSAVSIALTSIDIFPRTGQGGIPAVKGVYAGAWIESTTATRVAVGFNAKLLAADDTYQQLGVVYALLTFYFTD